MVNINKEAAERLCFGDGFYPLDDEFDRLRNLLAGKVQFRRKEVDLTEWERPSSLQESLHSSWLFYYHSLVWTDPLRRAFLSTGDEKYFLRLVQIVSSWVERHGLIPDPPPTSKAPGDYSWYDMSAAWRSIVLIGVVSVAPRPDEVADWLHPALSAHLDALKDERFYANIGNHALHQNNALLSLGLVLQDEQAVSIAVDRIKSLLEISVDEEGVALEGSPAYHLFNLIWWNEARERLKIARDTRPDVDVPTIPSMNPFLRDSLAPDGKFVLLGDTTLSQKPLLTVIGDKYPAALVDQLMEDPELRYVLSMGKGGQKPASTTSLYSDGFWFSRSSWDLPFHEQSMVSVRFGTAMKYRVHAHEDAGSVTYYPRGGRLIEDGGLFGYYGGKNREFVKSQSAHNVVIVPDAKYYITGEAPLDSVIENESASMIRVHVNVIEKCKWHRTVFHGRSTEMLLVQDIVKTGDEREITQLWNLGDDVVIEKLVGNRLDISSNAQKASLFFYGGALAIDLIRGQETPQLGWRSSFEGKIQPTYAVRVKHNGPEAKILMCCIPMRSESSFDEIESIRAEFRTSETIVHVQGTGKEVLAIFGSQKAQLKASA